VESFDVQKKFFKVSMKEVMRAKLFEQEEVVEALEADHA
jgi:hypothetical protein